MQLEEFLIGISSNDVEINALLDVTISKAYEINRYIPNPELLIYDLFMVPVHNREE
jgi:hypothetical protein